MKILDITQNEILKLSMLNEANVINIKDEFEGHDSIAMYLKHYAENLPQQAQKGFIKKLSKLLINDERFLYAVRKLPANAPDWAKEAQAKGDLMYFKSSQELDQKMEHLMHYVAVIQADAADTSNRDQQAVANREIQGFPKAENLDVLIKKSDEYFKRGSKKAGAQIEGMKEIMDTGEGFKWFLLQSQDAYRRAGKILQNCIGSHYTRTRTQNSGEEIIVLRGPSGDFHVAARIKNKEHEIQEMKGKNNRPPIDKYMAPVIKFVNKMKLKLGWSAEHDFKRTGYFWIANKLYPRAEAIKKFVSKKKIGTTEKGLGLVQVDIGNSQLAEELFGDVYPEFANFFRRQQRGTLSIYEMRNKQDKPVITGLVISKSLEAMHRHKGGVSITAEGVIFEDQNVKATEGIGAEFVRELVRQGIIDGVSSQMQKEMFWNDRVQLNTKTGEFEPIRVASKFRTDKEHLEWEEHTNKDLVKQIRNSLAKNDYGNWSSDTSISKVEAKDVIGAYVTSTQRKKGRDEQQVNLVLLKTKQRVLVPALVARGGRAVDTSEITLQGGEVDARYRERHMAILNSVVALANKEKADLTKSFRFTNGLVKEKDTYKLYKPEKKELGGEPSGAVYDLSDVDYGDRPAALNAIITSGTYRKRETPGEDTVHRDDLYLTARMHAAVTGKTFKRRHHHHYGGIKVIDDASDWDGKEVREVFEQAFDGKVPDAVYLVDIKYGSDKTHEVLLLTQDKKIITVDGTTTAHEFQKWDDYDKVAEQINAFVEKHGLSFMKNALEKENELRLYQGKVYSASGVQRLRLAGMKEKGKIGLEGTDELPFEDGAKLVRMSSEEQATWARKGLKTDVVPGEAWKMINPRGKPIAVVLVKDNAVQSMFTEKPWKRRWNEPEPPDDDLLLMKDKRVKKKPAQYLKTAMDTFGWGVKNVAQFVIAPDSKQHKILKVLQRSPGARTNVLNRAYGAVVPAGWDRAGAADRHLYELGLLDMNPRGRTKQLSITPLGKQALEQLEKGKSIQTTGVAGSVEIEKGWKKPKRKEPPKLPTRGQRGTITGKTKAGSKAAQALDKFEEFVVDNNRIPTRGEFMEVLQDDPFNMSRTGAQTYYYTTKAKYNKRREQAAQANESLAQAASFRFDSSPFGALRALLVG